MIRFSQKAYVVLMVSTTAILLKSCGSSAAIVSTPIANIDVVPLKTSPLTEAEEKNWHHLDLVNDTIPGISLEQTYKKLIKPKGKSVIVAVIDSGIDLDHEDLKSNIWVNTKEIPNNNIDDDNNGYIDDINGWNFLGESNLEQLEYTRLVASGDSLNIRYKEAESLLRSERIKYIKLQMQYNTILNQLNSSDAAVKTFLGTNDYSKDDLYAVETTDRELQRHVDILKDMLDFGYDNITELKGILKNDLKRFDDKLKYQLNLYFDGRAVVGDDPDNLNDIGYGNNNVRPRGGRTHGTHVSGIIAGQRNNGIGIDGVANNVKIMAIRNTPNGDEYDKDIALAVYYAVDNGAKVINMSFGKQFSSHSNWVREAIIYAEKKGVLIVSGAGNDGENIDVVEYYPDDHVEGVEVSDNFIKVGAINPTYGSELVAEYSNYGLKNVDIFAPGSQIYSTYPKNEYEFAQGTSMASPVVAGVAALIFSQYPQLSAKQVKEIILSSGTPIKRKVVLANKKTVAFSELSKSGRIINAYNALLMASKLSN